MPESLKRIVPVAALTGLRQGELFDLEVDDLDLDRAVLQVRHGKTKAATRAVDLPALCVQLLREQLVARRHTSDRLVFPAPLGGRLRRDNFNARFFRPATKHAGLEGVTTHSLRHTYVSLSAMAGVRVEVIAQQIGHVDGGALLLRRYRHLFAGETKDAATKLEALIRPQEKKAREESA